MGCETTLATAPSGGIAFLGCCEPSPSCCPFFPTTASSAFGCTFHRWSSVSANKRRFGILKCPPVPGDNPNVSGWFVVQDSGIYCKSGTVGVYLNVNVPHIGADGVVNRWDGSRVSGFYGDGATPDANHNPSLVLYSNPYQLSSLVGEVQAAMDTLSPLSTDAFNTIRTLSYNAAGQIIIVAQGTQKPIGLPGSEPVPPIICGFIWGGFGDAHSLTHNLFGSMRAEKAFCRVYGTYAVEKWRIRQANLPPVFGSECFGYTSELLECRSGSLPVGQTEDVWCEVKSSDLEIRDAFAGFTCFGPAYDRIVFIARKDRTCSNLAP